MQTPAIERTDFAPTLRRFNKNRSAHFQRESRTQLTNETTRRMQTGLIYHFMAWMVHSAGANGRGNMEKGPDPLTEQVEQVRRNVTFIARGQLHVGVERAHLGILLDLKDAVNQYSEIRKAVDKSHELTLKMGIMQLQQERFMNFSYARLGSGLEHTRSALEFACDLVDCDLEIPTSSQTVSPQQMSAQSDNRELDRTLLILNYNRHFKLDHMKVHESPNREKRQVGIILGGAALGLSIYNLAETQQLKADLFEQSKKTDRVAALLNREHYVIKQNSVHINHLNKGLEEIQSSLNREVLLTQFQTATSYMDFVLRDLNQWIESFTDAVLHRSLNPRIFPVPTIKLAIKDIKERASKLQLIPRSLELSDILREPVSSVSLGTKVYLMIHILLTKPNEFYLYEYVNIPLLLADGKTVKIYPPKTFIAVNTHLTEFMQFSPSELDKCDRTENAYLCEGSLVEKSIMNSCIGGLYIGFQETIAKFCPFEIYNPTKEVIVQVGTRSVVIFIPEKTHLAAFLVCTNHSSTQVKAVSHARIDIPQDCTLTTNNYEFEPMRSSHIKDIYVSKSLQQFDLSISNITLKIGNWTPLQSVTPIPDSEYEHLTSPQIHHPVFISVFVCSSIIATVSVAAAVYLFVRIKRADRRRRATRRRQQEPERTPMHRRRTSDGAAIGEQEREERRTNDAGAAADFSSFSSESEREVIDPKTAPTPFDPENYM